MSLSKAFAVVPALFGGLVLFGFNTLVPLGVGQESGFNTMIRDGAPVPLNKRIGAALKSTSGSETRLRCQRLVHRLDEMTRRRNAVLSSGNWTKAQLIEISNNFDDARSGLTAMIERCRGGSAVKHRTSGKQTGSGRKSINRLNTGLNAGSRSVGDRSVGSRSIGDRSVGDRTLTGRKIEHSVVKP